MRSTLARFLSLTIALILVAALINAQPKGKKSYVFKGTVASVDASTNNLMVANEKIEGWMDAMTMKYDVDDPAVLKQLKKGDHIQATVYDGDLKLYKVKVVPPGTK
jgi:Cu/Ag efflux protein CusF